MITLNELITKLTRLRDNKPEVGNAQVGLYYDTEDADDEVNATDISLMAIHEVDIIEDQEGDPSHVSLTFGSL